MNLNIGGMLASRSTKASSTGGSMKIGTKIFGLVGFCLALLALVAGAGIWQMEKIGVEIEGIAERDLPMTKGLTQITIHQLEQAINFERAIRTGEEMVTHPAARQEFAKAVGIFEELTGKVDKEFVEVEELAKHAMETASNEADIKEFGHVLSTLEKLGTEHKDYDHLAIQAFKLVNAGEIEQALTLLPKIEAEETDLDQGLEKLLAELEEFTAEAALTAEEHEKFALLLMLIITGIALVTGSGFAYVLIKKSITRPLDEVVTGINALTSGDLSMDV
ncbi:MAG: MCP four helix bundle domain-containing protein [Alphaproteobacteria bacterium]